MTDGGYFIYKSWIFHCHVSRKVDELHDEMAGFSTPTSVFK
jgi:hypothetical protein